MTTRPSCYWQRNLSSQTRAGCRHNRESLQPVFARAVGQMWIRAVRAMQWHTSRVWVRRSRLLLESMHSAAEWQVAYQRSLLCLLFTTFFLGVFFLGVFFLRILFLGECPLRARTSSTSLVGRALSSKTHVYGVLYKNVLLDKKNTIVCLRRRSHARPRSFAGAVRPEFSTTNKLR